MLTDEVILVVKIFAYVRGDSTKGERNDEYTKQCLMTYQISVPPPKGKRVRTTDVFDPFPEFS